MMTTTDESANRGGQWGLTRRCALLTAALLFAYAGLSPVVYPLAGGQGLFTAGAALLVCLTSGVLALLVSEPFRQPELVVLHVLLATGIRTGIPLVLVMVIYLRPGPMTEAGFVYYLLAFYMLTLLVETGLTVQAQRVEANRPAKAS